MISAKIMHTINIILRRQVSNRIINGVNNANFAQPI